MQNIKKRRKKRNLLGSGAAMNRKYINHKIHIQHQKKIYGDKQT